MTAATLFSGIGGSDFGLEQAGCRVVYAGDIDAHAREAYALNHDVSALRSGRVDHRDVNDVQGADIGDVGLLVSSPPCQPWSSMGKRRGEADERNCFPAYLRLLGEAKPTATICENVSRLAGDAYFKKIIRGVRALGYGAAARKVNAADLGVPQDRERLIIVGLRGASDDDARRAFPKTIAPRLGLRDVCPDVIRVEGHEFYKPLFRPHSQCQLLPLPAVRTWPDGATAR